MASYSIELYNSQGAVQTLIADITMMVDSFNYMVPLNNFEELSFNLDLEGWKDYCQSIAIDPYLSIRPYTAEIKLKRNNVYLPMAFEIKQAAKKYSANDATISIVAKGTLSKLGDAIITKQYTGVDATEIARDIIAYRQAKPYGNFGITNGNTYLTGTPTNRSYAQYVCMEAIRNLSDDASGGFDFYFDHDWKFYTMAKRGNTLDLFYRFGLENSNLLEYENPEDANKISNSLTIVGNGIGDPILNEDGTGLDVESALTFGLRETALVYSEIDNQTWLNDKAAAELRDRKNMYDLPKLIASGNDLDLNTVWVGDTFNIECTDAASPYLGQGRIKQLDVAVDVNHQEVITAEMLKV